MRIASIASFTRAIQRGDCSLPGCTGSIHQSSRCGSAPFPPPEMVAIESYCAVSLKCGSDTSTGCRPLASAGCTSTLQGRAQGDRIKRLLTQERLHQWGLHCPTAGSPFLCVSDRLLRCCKTLHGSESCSRLTCPGNTACYTTHSNSNPAQTAPTWRWRWWSYPAAPPAACPPLVPLRTGCRCGRRHRAGGRTGM